MKLGAVVSAVNENPHYMSFVPQFLRAWTTLFPTVEIIVVVIADEMPVAFKPYEKYLRLFPVSSTGVSTVLAAQCIRLLWPRVVSTTDAVLITDIDMLPLQRDYYTAPIRDISDDTVVVYRHGLPDELYMCYVAATPTVWRGMFGDEPHLDIIKRWYDDANVWNKDQTELTKAFNAWGGPKKLYTDREIGFRRICRSFLELPPERAEYQLLKNPELMRFYIQSGHFTDYHALANGGYSDLNEFVVDSLVGLLDKSVFTPTATYVSYLPLVFEALVALPNAPIIECGMGHGSTPILSTLHNRTVIHYDTNLDWLERFDVPNKYLVDPQSWVSLITMHKSAHPIVLLDQAPGEVREKCIEELTTDFDGIVVAHDTEPAADHGYQMRKHFSSFKYVVEVKTVGAWATAMSNNVNLEQWIGLTFGEFTISPFTDRRAPLRADATTFTPVPLKRSLYPFLHRK